MPTAEKALDLTLTFRNDANGVRICWESVPLGVRDSTFVTPYGGDGLDAIIRALDILQHPNYASSAADSQTHQSLFTSTEQEHLKALGLWSAEGRVQPHAARTIGRSLYAALANDPQGAQALDTVRNHASAVGQPLALHLHFPPDAVELAALPWETLQDNGPAPLLLSRGRLASCTRHIDLAEALPPPRTGDGPLRILALAPEQRIPPTVRDAERAARLAAWQPLIDKGQVVLTEISPATRTALIDAIQAGPPPDIIHYYGHGRYKDGQGALLLDAPGGGSAWTEVNRLVALLGQARLVVLYACQGAMVGDDTAIEGLLTGVAPALSAAGVPLVVGMQLTVRIQAATRATSILYNALARGQSVQEAVNQIRQALYFEEDDQTSWYMPTLYIRARNHELAYLVVPTPPPDSQNQPSINAPRTSQTIVARGKSTVSDVKQHGSDGAQQAIRADTQSRIEQSTQRATTPTDQTIAAEDEGTITGATQDDSETS